MSFLLDTDTCSAYLKGDRRVWGSVHAAQRRAQRFDDHCGRVIYLGAARQSFAEAVGEAPGATCRGDRVACRYGGGGNVRNHSRVTAGCGRPLSGDGSVDWSSRTGPQFDRRHAQHGRLSEHPRPAHRRLADPVARRFTSFPSSAWELTPRSSASRPPPSRSDAPRPVPFLSPLE